MGLQKSFTQAVEQELFRDADSKIRFVFDQLLNGFPGIVLPYSFNTVKQPLELALPHLEAFGFLVPNRLFVADQVTASMQSAPFGDGGMIARVTNSPCATTFEPVGRFNQAGIVLYITSPQAEIGTFKNQLLMDGFEKVDPSAFSANLMHHQLVKSELRWKWWPNEEEFVVLARLVELDGQDKCWANQ